MSPWPSCLHCVHPKQGLLWVKFSAGPRSARAARADGWLLTGKPVQRRRRSAALLAPGEKSWWSLKWISFMFHYRLLQPCASTLWVFRWEWGTGRKTHILQLLWLAVILKAFFLSNPTYEHLWSWFFREALPFGRGLLVCLRNCGVIILFYPKRANTSI